MRFSKTADGKNVFLSVDSSNITHNPLFKAFKAKTFTDRDIMLHFYIFDILAGGGYSASDIDLGGILAAF